ncbi:HvfC/BufC N-terminal domain-containing protein [Taklimakanibacter deserti]|uniref:HvfC/BufC N-terminal domain-containing protein n=1 Tax=Taklimakanibacter deserti TaxID=2267839 RepID=UPI000E656D3D
MSNMTQAAFAAALLDRAKPVPQGLRSASGSAPARRYGVYRNNVATGLARALAARFPITEKIVGEEFFTAMARDFVLGTPPTSPVLLHYGGDFPDFVAAFPPAAGLPYLADIVRLENAQVKAYHARDIAAVDPQALSRIAPERMSGLVFIFHPAATVLTSSHPIVTIWAMNSGAQALVPIENWRAENALVTRPELTVLTREIGAGSASFLLALMKGATLGEAYESAMDADPDFDLGRNLADLLRSGAVIDITAEPSLEA